VSERRKAEEFFAALDRAAIVRAIREAEAQGRGEIRVHLHHGRVPDPKRTAEQTFIRLRMDKTELRSGCLLFIAPEEQAFVVLGDKGIHERVGPDFWLEARDVASARFAEGRFTEGIVAAVGKLGDALARHFPKEAGVAEPNELADDVSEE